MKLNILFKQWMVVLLALFALTFTSCSDDDDDSGSSQVVLEAYGPSPALRGSELTFIGQNMDKVTCVVLPGSIEITDIEVLSSEKIKIIIPQDAAEGYVKLETSDGELTSKTLLVYTEPISISSISPNPVKAGETLIIEGDYLNLIQKVVFDNDVTVKCADFTIWERAKIAFVVPKTAQTGMILLTDTATMPVEVKSNTILNVTLPSVISIAEFNDQKPGNVISVTGADLDLVESVVLANNDLVDFTITGNTLSFTLPSETTDGEIDVVAYSGVVVPITQITMAVPTDLNALPATDLRGDDVITISGENMDLITTATFAGVTDVVYPSSSATDKITVVMPSAAISGNLILNTGSGKSVTVGIATQKPDIIYFNPSPVSAGKDVTLVGTNLDLVTAVTFTGDLTVDANPSSDTELTITVPADAETGVLILTMANGETVESPSLIIDKPEFCYIPALPSSETEIDAGTLLTVDVHNEEKLSDVQVNSVSTQYILQGSTIHVLIPNNAGGKTDLTLISSNGEITYQIDVIGTETPETVIFEGPISLTWSDGGRAIIPASAFEGVSVGSVMKISFIQTDNWGQAQINNGNWAAISFAELNDGAYLTTDLYNDKSVSEQELVLTQDILDNILANASSGDGIIIQGSDWVISKISIIAN